MIINKVINENKKLKTKRKGLFRAPLVLNVKKVFYFLLNVKVLGITSPETIVMVEVTPRPRTFYEIGKLFNSPPLSEEIHLPIIADDEKVFILAPQTVTYRGRLTVGHTDHSKRSETSASSIAFSAIFSCSGVIP